MGLFENLAATDDSAIISHRKATAVANKRVKDRFGAFLANSQDNSDLSARVALVTDDVTAIVQEVTAEYGGDAQKIEAAIRRSMGEIPGAGMGMGGMGQPGQPGTCPQCGGPMPCPQHGNGAVAPGNQGVGLQNGAMPIGQSTGAPMMASTTAAGGFCDKCKNWKSGPKAGCTCDGDETEAEDATVDRDEPGEDGTDAKASSFRLARRPKLCPYHSEVVDISLGSGDPQAGFNAMSGHAWGDNHCKGGFDGSCNFRPQMVTQSYWDDKQAEYAERRQQRELGDNIGPGPELSIDTEPIMHAEPLPDEPGQEGVSDIDGELANAPSAVGSGELAMASSRKEAEALTTEKLPTGDDTALGGPSPKIDKGNSGDQNGWTLDAIDTQMKGTPNPTTEQDPTTKADYGKDDFLDQTRAVTETVELDSAPDLMNDAGFAPGGEEHGPHTKTFPKGDQANPVTQTALSAVDPDKNPLRSILDEYEGFLMPNQVESALQDWSVGG